MNERYKGQNTYKIIEVCFQRTGKEVKVLKALIILSKQKQILIFLKKHTRLIKYTEFIQPVYGEIMPIFSHCHNHIHKNKVLFSDKNCEKKQG